MQEPSLSIEENPIPVRIFVSYAREDKKWLDPAYRFQLVPYLRDSLRWHGVTFWFDSELIGGDEFRRHIESEIEQASIALLVISQSFLNSEFIRTKEMPRIEERASRGKLVVVPVLVEPCDWVDYPFLADRQMVPTAEPLINHTESEAAWARVKFQILDGLKSQVKRIRAEHVEEIARQQAERERALLQAEAERARKQAEQGRPAPHSASPASSPSPAADPAQKPPEPPKPPSDREAAGPDAARSVSDRQEAASAKPEPVADGATKERIRPVRQPGVEGPSQPRNPAAKLTPERPAGAEAKKENGGARVEPGGRSEGKPALDLKLFVFLGGLILAVGIMALGVMASSPSILLWWLSGHSSAHAYAPPSDLEKAWVAKARGDFTAALSYFTSACDGDAYDSSNWDKQQACSELADMYGTGTGVAKDVHKWEEYYGRSCDYGNAERCDKIGDQFYNGYRVNLDYRIAGDFYKKACDDGVALACDSLGTMYDEANGLKRDYEAAATLYSRACEGGDAGGCNNLGSLYFNGDGVPKDNSKAITLYTKACDRSIAEGCKNLGYHYWRGEGVDQDITKAKEYLDKGCKMGDQDECKWLQKLK